MKRILTLLLSCIAFLSSEAQVFPYIESFDSYATNQPLNGDGGITATSHVYVTPYGVHANCAEFQMAAGTATDTLTSPLIGPLTGHSITSFYFRVVNINGGVPSLYNMSGTDMAVIYVGTTLVGNTVFIPQDTISAANQNTTTSYVKVVVPIPGVLSNYSGWFRIVTYNPGGNTWKLELDSLVVRDTLPVPPTLVSIVEHNTHCRGDSTGSITVTASTQNPPLTYLWSTGDTGRTISNKPAGVYTVTVSDYWGGTAAFTDTIRQPMLALILDSLTKTDALCHGGSSGTAHIYPDGGTPPYSYLWSTVPASHTDSATGLSTGNYNVTVTDAGFCQITATVHISQPASSMTTATSTTQSTLGNNGTATVIVTNATGTMHYQWSTSPVQTTAIASGLAPGLYEVTVADGSGCVIVDTVFVAFPAGINKLSGATIAIYPVPTGNELHIDVKGISNLELSAQIIDMSGRIVVSEEKLNGTISTKALADGIYLLRLSTDGESYTRKLLIQH
jgi:Secretion system C-terminal sorting domain/SprB repeat